MDDTMKLSEMLQEFGEGLTLDDPASKNGYFFVRYTHEEYMAMFSLAMDLEGALNQLRDNITFFCDQAGLDSNVGE